MSADKNHQTVFGHLASKHFTAAEAAEYLEIPESALQALITVGRLHPIGDGRFPIPELKSLKQFLKTSETGGSIFADLVQSLKEAKAIASGEAPASRRIKATPRYTLAELLAQCDASAEISAEDRAWFDAPAVGHELPDDDEDRRIDAIAAERVATFDPAKAIPMEDMLRKYGMPSESIQEALRELESGKSK